MLHENKCHNPKKHHDLRCPLARTRCSKYCAVWRKHAKIAYGTSCFAFSKKKQFSICCTMSQSNVLLNAFFCVLTANTPKHEPMCAEYSGVCSVECGLWSVECGGWCVGVCIYRVWSAERATRHIVHTQHSPHTTPHTPPPRLYTLHSLHTLHTRREEIMMRSPAIIRARGTKQCGGVGG